MRILQKIQQRNLATGRKPVKQRCG